MNYGAYHFKKWDPVGRQARAAILLIHGAMEHSGRYEHVGEWLNQRGIAVCAGDLPGHGWSKGRRGHVSNFNEYLNAISEFFVKMRRMYPDVPLFLLGHSMGVLALIRFLQNQDEPLPIRGVILCSPCLALQMSVPDWKNALAKTINRILPGLRLSTGILPDMVCRSPEAIAAYVNDRLVSQKASVRWYQELQNAMQIAMWQAPKIDVPLLVLQAGADQLVRPEATREFVKTVSSGDKTYSEFPDCYHELLQEPERFELLQQIVVWCEKRI